MSSTPKWNVKPSDSAIQRQRTASNLLRSRGSSNASTGTPRSTTSTPRTEDSPTSSLQNSTSSGTPDGFSERLQLPPQNDFLTPEQRALLPAELGGTGQAKMTAKRLKEDKRKAKELRRLQKRLPKLEGENRRKAFQRLESTMQGIESDSFFATALKSAAETKEANRIVLEPLPLSNARAVVWLSEFRQRLAAKPGDYKKKVQPVVDAFRENLNNGTIEVRRRVPTQTTVRNKETDEERQVRIFEEHSQNVPFLLDSLLDPLPEDVAAAAARIQQARLILDGMEACITATQAFLDRNPKTSKQDLCEQFLEHMTHAGLQIYEHLWEQIATRRAALEIALEAKELECAAPTLLEGSDGESNPAYAGGVLRSQPIHISDQPNNSFQWRLDRVNALMRNALGSVEGAPERVVMAMDSLTDYVKLYGLMGHMLHPIDTLPHGLPQEQLKSATDELNIEGATKQSAYDLLNFAQQLDFLNAELARRTGDTLVAPHRRVQRLLGDLETNQHFAPAQTELQRFVYELRAFLAAVQTSESTALPTQALLMFLEAAARQEGLDEAHATNNQGARPRPDQGSQLYRESLRDKNRDLTVGQNFFREHLLPLLQYTGIVDTETANELHGLFVTNEAGRITEAAHEGFFFADLEREREHIAGLEFALNNGDMRRPKIKRPKKKHQKFGFAAGDAVTSRHRYKPNAEPGRNHRKAASDAQREAQRPLEDRTTRNVEVQEWQPVLERFSFAQAAQLRRQQPPL